MHPPLSPENIPSIVEFEDLADSAVVEIADNEATEVTPKWFRAYSEGNGLLPQTGLGLVSYVAGEALGDASQLENFIKSSFSSGQLALLGKQLNNMHKAHGVPYTYVGENRYFNDDGSVKAVDALPDSQESLEPDYTVWGNRLNGLWENAKMSVFYEFTCMAMYKHYGYDVEKIREKFNEPIDRDILSQWVFAASDANPALLEETRLLFLEAVQTFKTPEAKRLITGYKEKTIAYFASRRGQAAYVYDAEERGAPLLTALAERVIANWKEKFDIPDDLAHLMLDPISAL